MRCQSLDCRLTAGVFLSNLHLANKESADGGRSPRHSTVTRFAYSPSPCPLPGGEGAWRKLSDDV